MVSDRAAGRHADRALWALILLAALIGAVARVADLGGRGFTLDEAFSVWAVASPGRAAEVLPRDNHPPLWYGLLAAWIAAVGDDDVRLRISSVAAGLAWIPLLAALAVRMFDRRTAALAALLAALWPLAVHAQREVRMYAWLPLLSTCATLAVVHAVERGGRRAWAASGLALALVGAVHFSGLALAAGVLAGALWSGAPRRGVALATAVAAALSIPSAVLLAMFVGREGRGSAGLGPGSPLRLWSGLAVGELPHVDPALVLVLATLVGAAAAYGATRLGPWSRLVGGAVVGAGLVPAALAATVFTFPLTPAYFTVLVPFVVLVVARAAAAARRPAARAVSALAVAAVAVGFVLAFATRSVADGDWRDLAELVRRETAGERTVVIAPPFLAVPFERYYRGVLPVRALAPEDVRAEAGAPAAAWLVVPDSDLTLVPYGAAEVPTGWWMRAFRVGAVR